MGTNFFFITKDKKLKDELFGWDEWELTDEPDWGYLIHLAKTSLGWKPLFQGSQSVKSVADIKHLFDKGAFKIVDEYGEYYDWPAFEKRVIDFNKDNPDAISHPKYENGKYWDHYFVDSEGYEFSRSWFR